MILCLQKPIEFIGLNTIGCPDEECEYSVLYRREELMFESPVPRETAEKLKDKLEATGIAIVKDFAGNLTDICNTICMKNYYKQQIGNTKYVARRVDMGASVELQ